MRTFLAVLLVVGCGSVKQTSPDATRDTTGPLTAPTVTITNHVIAGTPITCKIATQSTGGSGPITYSATWTLDGLPFPGATMTMFAGDTVPGTATHTGKVFACTVTATDGTTMKAAAPQGVVVDGRFAFAILSNTTPDLVKLDLDTKQITTIGPLGVTYAFGDLAWNSKTQTLYMVDGRGLKQLYRVDTATGAATVIGTHGLTDMFALGYDPVADKLFGGLAGGASTVQTLSTTTGLATALGGTNGLDAITFDTKRSQPLGITGGPGTIFTIDPTTGATTQVATPGSNDNCGMTYDPFIDRVWVADFQGRLFQHDPNNGFTRTLVMTFPGSNFTALAIILPPS